MNVFDRYSDCECAHWLLDPEFARFIAERDRADELAQEANDAPDDPTNEGVAA